MFSQIIISTRFAQHYNKKQLNLPFFMHEHAVDVKKWRLAKQEVGHGVATSQAHLIVGLHKCRHVLESKASTV